MLWVGCKNELNTKRIKLAEISLEVPINFDVKTNSGIDSRIYSIIDKRSRDTFFAEYGDNSIVNPIFRAPPPVFSLQDKAIITKKLGRVPTEEEALFSDDPVNDERLNIFSKEFILYDTIGGMIVKIGQPKQVGIGITGMYIPFVKEGKSFSIYAKNLDSAHQTSAIYLFRTVRIE